MGFPEEGNGGSKKAGLIGISGPFYIQDGESLRWKETDPYGPGPRVDGERRG
jgi:hypothetical protein